jgi:hypothetical protein
VFIPHADLRQPRVFQTQIYHTQTMKKILFFLLFSCVLSCHKDDFEWPLFEPGPLDTGRIDALREGVHWAATAWAKRYKGSLCVFVIFTTYNKFGELREEWNTCVLPQTGTQKITEASYATLFSDGDVIGPVYFINKSEDYFLEVTRLDTFTHELEGKFKRLVLNRVSKDYPEYPSALTFVDGVFKVKYEP